MLMAHRGLSSLAPENTSAAIQMTANYGIEWVELDVQLSKDGVPIIIHDESFRRYNGNKSFIRNLTLEQIKAEDVGSWFDASYDKERVPTLEEALKLCEKLNLGVNLEIKHYPEDDPYKLTRNICDTIKNLGFAEDQLIISCFSAEILGLCKQYMPNVRRGYICLGCDPKVFGFLNGLKLYSMHAYYPRLTLKIVNDLKQLNLVPMIWTLNNPSLAPKYYDMGVKFIMSDYPHIFDNPYAKL